MGLGMEREGDGGERGGEEKREREEEGEQEKERGIRREGE